MICKYCESEDTEIIRGPFGPHAAKEVCKECDRYLRWVSRKEIEDPPNLVKDEE